MGSDVQLVEAWRRGDREAGETLFDRHFDRLYRFFRTKADLQDVDDLVQQTFMGCVQGRERFRGDANITTYLLAIARNKLLAYWRSKKRGREVEFHSSAMRDLNPSPSSLAMAQERDRFLLEALRRIPVDMQIAIELRYWEGMSGPEVAEVLEIPEGTVRSRLRRGLDALRDALHDLATSDQGLESTTEDLDAWADELRQRCNV
ncbi:MAG: RNA polymerase sigma factor [Myxococcota bacterium]